jgi:hypothetical protein
MGRVGIRKLAEKTKESSIGITIGGRGGTQFLKTPINKTISVIDQWTDLDLSGDIEYGATGAIFRIVNNAGTTKMWGLRKNGSIDDVKDYIYTSFGTFAVIGLDENNKCEYYAASTDLDFYLVGYTKNDAVFFTNHYDKSLATYEEWIEMDLSSQLPAGAVAAIFHVDTVGFGVTNWGLRKNGSSDDRHNCMDSHLHTFFIVGVDSDRKCEGYAGSSFGHLYLVGYLTRGQALLNGTDRSLGIAGSYVTIDESSDAFSNASGVICELNAALIQRRVAGRRLGATDDPYDYCIDHPGMLCIGLDTDKKWEGKIEGLEVDFFTIGYFAEYITIATKESSIGITVVERKTKESSIGISIQETHIKESSIGLTIKQLIRIIPSWLCNFEGISEDGRIEIFPGVLEDGRHCKKTEKTKESSIGLLIQETKTKDSSVSLSIQETKTKESIIGMHIVTRKTKDSSVGLSIQETKTKESSIGLSVQWLELEKVSVIGIRIIALKTKVSSMGLSISCDFKISSIGLRVVNLPRLEKGRGIFIFDGISEDGRTEISHELLEDGNFKKASHPKTKDSSIGLIIRETKTKDSSIGLIIRETKTKDSSIGMCIYGSNIKTSSIGLTPVDPILKKGFFYAKLGATTLYGVTPENFRISKEINKIPTFEFEIANCTENRAAIAAGIENEFKVYWQHHGADTLIFTGIINADGIEYVSLDSIEITGYASYVVLSWPFHKHLADEDKESVDRVFDFDGSYSDYTTQANNDTINDVYVTFGDTDQAFYIGNNNIFWGAQIKYSTAGIPDPNSIIIIEYSKGSGTWGTLDVLDESDAFTQSAGTYNLIIPHPPNDWERNTVNSIKRYWIRYRLSGVDPYILSPKLDQIYIVNVDIYRTYYFDISARQILLNALEGTEYSMDTTDACPEDEISLIADYESPLRIVAAIPNALTWTDTDGSKKAYQWWVDDSKKVHIKQRRGTIQPDDITGDMTIFNNHEDYFHLSNRLHGLGPRDGLSQIRAIVEDRASIAEHKLREIAVPKEQIGKYIMLRNALEKDIAISKAPMQRIKGSVTTEFYGLRGYEVGDTVTLHQTAWNLNEIQMQIVKVEIGPMRTTIDLGISQEHLEGLKDNMHRRFDLNNVRMHGSTTILQAGPERMNYQRVSASEVYAAKLEIEIPSEVKKIHKVLISWTIGPYRADVGPNTIDGPGHDHDGWAGDGGAIGSDTVGPGGASTPDVLGDGDFTPQMLGKAHKHLLETDVTLNVSTSGFYAPTSTGVSGLNHRHLKGRTSGPDDTQYAYTQAGWDLWCDACNAWLINSFDHANFALGTHWHLNTGLYTGYTNPSGHIAAVYKQLIQSIDANAISEMSNNESPAHIHDGVYEPSHDHVGVYEGPHSDHATSAIPAHGDHLIVTEPGISGLALIYSIHEEAPGTTLELLVNDEKIGEYNTAQTEIRIDGYMNSGNNTIALQPIVGQNKKGSAKISGNGLLFVEPRKF